MARIALLLPSLEAGGAERVTLTLAAEFLALGDEVDLLVLRNEGALADAVPRGVRLVELDAPRLRQAARPIAAYCARMRPDALLAAWWPLTSIALWAARGCGTRVILAEHNTMSVYARTWPLIPRLLLRPAMRWSHRRADAVVAVSRDAARDLARLCGVPEDAVTTIHNPAVPPRPVDPSAYPEWGATGRRLLTVGTLKAQKNHRLLLRAFALMARPDDRLAIIGEGEERDAIERTARALGVADRVLLPGFTHDPGRWYASADLFVLSSDYEGLPMVLIEALGHGRTVVSTDCPSGPAEILGSLGRLVPVGDAATLADAIEAALAAPDDPAAARARAADFAPAPIAAQYRALLLGER